MFEAALRFGRHPAVWARLCSEAILAIIPAILLIALTQRYRVRAQAMGAVKG